jgi:cytochrome c oxidase assembly factor CtaG
MIVPTLTMLGRSWCPWSREAGIVVEAVATAPLCPEPPEVGTPPPRRGRHILVVVTPTLLSPLSVGEDALARFSAGRVFETWDLLSPAAVLILLTAALYLSGVVVLRRRGDGWPIGRTVSFVVVGLGSAALATVSGLATYDDTLLSVHMVQHMILSMLVPLSLALGAPVTLALRTLPRRPRRWLLSLLHSRFAKVLSFAPLTFALYVFTPWALYFSGWYAATLRSDYLHEMSHLHLVLVGCLFFWPLMGIDPLPGRITYPARMLLVVLTLPFHAFLGITIMTQDRLLGGSWYPSLHRGPMADWLPAPHADQHLAGGILWTSGDAIGVLFFAVLFVQWARSSMREAVREDRRLDLLEAREAKRLAAEAASSGPPPAAHVGTPVPGEPDR